MTLLKLLKSWGAVVLQYKTAVFCFVFVFIIYNKSNLLIRCYRPHVASHNVFQYSFVYLVMRRHEAPVHKSNGFSMVVVQGFSHWMALLVPLVQSLTNDCVYFFVVEPVIYKDLSNSFNFLVDCCPSSAVCECPSDVRSNGDSREPGIRGTN